tara:strand:- start:685 stop:1539 length:855 start_codon:yes stop_codon:yes gene_type:complete
MKISRIIESVVKKIFKIPNYFKSEKFNEIIRSAHYNTSSHKELLFSDHNKIYYILKNREEISKSILIHRQFDFKVLEKGLKYLKIKKKFLISVGSHVGTTLIPAIKLNLFEHCVAFEPSIDNFRLLTANININKIEKRVTLLNLALGSKVANGYLKLFHPHNSGDYRITKKNKNVEKIKLNILDNFTSKINRHNSLIFMDAQGHEPDIFLGGKKTLKKNIPIIFELEPNIINENKKKGLYNSLKDYKNLSDLKTNKVLKMNKINFYKIYEDCQKNTTQTDIIVF